MTVRNGASWIAASIQSIQNQTFPFWELIIVDDGSTDETPHILQSFAQRDSRIHVFFTEGIGRGPALNLALQHTRASYVANLDADDLAHPQRLEIALNAMQQHPSFALIASDGFVFSNQQTLEWPLYQKKQIRIFDITQQLMLFNPVLHSSVLMSREAVMAVNGYRESLRDNLDYDLWVRLAASGFRLGLLNLRLIGKRIHPDQSFEARRRLRYLLSSARVQGLAIRTIQAPLSHRLKACLFLGVRIAWGLLPQRVRFSFSKRRQRFAMIG